MLVFFEVVKAQDEGTPVSASRARAAERFHLSIEQIIKIEEEGLVRCWAPL